MSRIQRSALVARPARHMFDLVNDVDAYPRIFNWCEAASVIESSDTSMVARLAVRVAGLRTAFTTRNLLVPGERIDMALVDGPFKRLQGQWTFQALSPEASKVALLLDFDVAGSVVGSALALGFSGIADRFVDDFCREARRA